MKHAKASVKSSISATGRTTEVHNLRELQGRSDRGCVIARNDAALGTGLVLNQLQQYAQIIDMEDMEDGSISGGLCECL